MSTMELSKDTARVLALKRQLEELAGGITAYVEERLADADAVNGRLLDSLSEINDALDSALLMSVNETFADSGFKMI